MLYCQNKAKARTGQFSLYFGGKTGFCFDEQACFTAFYCEKAVIPEEVNKYESCGLHRVSAWKACAGEAD